VVLAGDRADADWTSLVEAVRSVYAPNTVVLHRPPGDAPAITRLAPFTEAQTPLDGRPVAFVCRNFSCDAPTSDAGELLDQLTK
jgi:uncharacterized protein YyaL (SSP411 family)